MNLPTQIVNVVIIALLLIIALSTFGLVITLVVYFIKKTKTKKRFPKNKKHNSSNPSTTLNPASNNIQGYEINKIFTSGRFSASERKAEYRRRGKSPSGVIDGVYNDSFRGNDSYNDSYRDWDADA